MILAKLVYMLVIFWWSVTAFGPWVVLPLLLVQVEFVVRDKPRGW